MADIYRQADSVLVWLGEDFQESSTSIRLIRQLLNSITEQEKKNGFGGQLTHEELLARGLPHADSPEWTKLELLFWRPWFSRVWIIQEIILPKSAIILWGAGSILWQDLCTAVSYISARNFVPVTGSDPTLPMTLIRIGSRYWHGGDLSLRELLQICRHSLATNPLDQVYALLGLASDKDTVGIYPDYRLSPEAIFQQIACVYLKNSLDMLGSVGDPRWKKLKLPSWVPDWSCRLREGILCYIHGAENHLNSGGATSPSIHFSTDKRLLFAQGTIVDEVARISYPFPVLRKPTRGWRDRTRSSDFVSDLTLDLQSNCFKQWEQLVLGLEQYPTGEDIKSVYHRTLIADVDIGQGRHGAYSTQCLASMYEAHRQHSILHRSTEDYDLAMANIYRSALWHATYGRKVITTKGGYVGLAPFSTLCGDKVVVLCGGKTPYIMRPSKKQERAYTFLGEAYIHGIMHGEVFERKSCTIEEIAIR